MHKYQILNIRCLMRQAAVPPAVVSPEFVSLIGAGVIAYFLVRGGMQVLVEGAFGALQGDMLHDAVALLVSIGTVQFGAWAFLGW